MANNFNKNGNIFSANDALDINELASLNDDFSNDFLDQLQNQIAQSANITNDGVMFEEPSSVDTNIEDPPNKTNTGIPSRINISDNFDDNFIKKYKAKLNKQEAAKEAEKDETTELESKQPTELSPTPEQSIKLNTEPTLEQQKTNDNSVQKNTLSKKTTPKTESEDIEKLSSGNISEKPINAKQIEYNESLDLLDGNIKYSKYVIYIDPENTEFIDSLTVKERKNLINKILKEQDVIVTTRNRFRTFKKIIKHLVVAIITITISVPLIYYLINVSLEATVSNYQRSKANFKILYKEKGKIKKDYY